MTDAISLFRSPALRLHAPAACHGFFGRTGGVSHGYFESLNTCAFDKDDSLENVMENRKRALNALHPNLQVLCINNQTHSTDVQVITSLPHTRIAADGMVTRLSSVALGIQTADCVPVLFASTSGVIGACHAGWKGALAGIVENTIAAMVAMGDQRQDIHAAVGPCIAQESYEVGQEFYDQFLNQSHENSAFFRPLQADTYLFDIRGYVERRLHEVGVEHISHVNYDTCQDEDHFFSNRRRTHRGEPTFGGQISLIAKVAE